ncbi:hypothetical protein [Magnetovibrio sp.]|uniref:hypothetical protein n=1 Tax=Magnetovibrio sp. TaxID=2024836 RepID=UPI002F944B7A
MKRSSVYGLAALVLIVAGSGALYWWTQASRQKCTDATRTENLFAIAQMIEDYHDQEDHYPFQSDGEPADVSLDDAFYDELQRVLGAEGVRRFSALAEEYTYSVDQGGYTLTTHLHNPVPQTKELGPNRHRLQVGSGYDPDEKLYPFLQISVNSILAASQAVSDRCH